MSYHAALKANLPDYLSVIHKNSATTVDELHHLGDAIIQTDLQFKITGWNAAAELIHGRPGAMGQNLFELVNINICGGTSIEEAIKELAFKGAWFGEVVFNRFDGKNICFRVSVTYIINEKDDPIAISIVSHNISDIKKKEEELAEAQNKYEILLNTMPDGVIMMNADGRIAACNKRGAEIFDLTIEEAVGNKITTANWEVIRQDGSVFPTSGYPAVVTLQTGFPQRNVVMGLKKPGGDLIWVSVNTQALFSPGEFEPYAVVISYSDITDSLKTEKELRQSNERFYYVSKVTSDAIWDFDMERNTIYRSEAFSNLSGYTADSIETNLDWWFNHVHPLDRERVKNKINEYISQQKDKWEDEYRFQCADGSYKFLLDSGMILYRNNKAVRILGALCDLTDQKKLEKQLLDEQAQKQQAITLARITAQEREKTNISRELHDNVNQILMSARLYMDTAKKMPDQAEILIDKAIEYQTIALHEIRQLSRTLNTSHIKTVGLKDSVQDIVDNMQFLQRLQVQFEYDVTADNKLTEEQKLMLFRVIQEQSSNIAKHAGATSVFIGISYAEGSIQLQMNDNGVGFDTSLNKEAGIGLINIRSRVEAHNGSVQIISSPGNGCKLELSFPVG
jgi:PAS domain S-box-containing protein